MFSIHSLAAKSTLLLILQAFALYTIPVLSERQKDSDYSLLESAYDPLVASLDRELNQVSLDTFLDNAKSSAIPSTAGMKKAQWYTGGLRFGKDVSVSGDDEQWEAYGISTVADSGYKSEKYENITAVSWGNENGGLRVTFLREDTKVKGKTVFEHALLVVPEKEKDGVTFRAVDNAVKEHGFVWRGKWLIITGGDLVRAFDTERVYKVDGEKNEVGKVDGKWYGGKYKFVIPQAKTITLKNKDMDSTFPMTVAALDRNCTTSCLVLGSTSKSNSYFARYEFSLPSSSTILTTFSSKAPTEAVAIWSFKTNVKFTRGWSYAGGEAYISSAANKAPSPQNNGGMTDLLVWKPGRWSDQYNNFAFGKPQGTSYDPNTNTMYTVGRVPNANDSGDPYIMTLDLSLRNSTAPTINGGGPVVTDSALPANYSPSSPFSDIPEEDSNTNPDSGKSDTEIIPTPGATPSESGTKSLPQGAIAGIAVGCICGFFALSICVYLYLHHRRYNPNSRSTTAASQRKWNEKANISGTGRSHKGQHIELSSTPAGSSTALGGGARSAEFGADGRQELGGGNIGNTTTVTGGQGPFGTGFATMGNSPVSPVRPWELAGTQRYEVGQDTTYYEVSGDNSRKV